MTIPHIRNDALAEILHSHDWPGKDWQNETEIVYSRYEKESQDVRGRFAQKINDDVCKFGVTQEEAAYSIIFGYTQIAAKERLKISINNYMSAHPEQTYGQAVRACNSRL